MSTESDVAYHSPNQHKYSCQVGIYRWHIEAFLGKLSDLLMQSQPRSVLDAGCGEGFVAHYLASRHPEAQFTGVDLSPEAIDYAQQHFGEAATYRTGSIYKLPFSDNSFDTVLCSEVLEHLDEPDMAVAELRRVARRFVLITVPLEPYFDWLNRTARALGISPDPGHVNFWTKTSFQQFLHSHFDEVTFDWKHIYQLALADVGSK